MYLTSAFTQKPGIYVRLGKILSPEFFFLRVQWLLLEVHSYTLEWFISSMIPLQCRYDVLWDMFYHTSEKKEVLVSSVMAANREEQRFEQTTLGFQRKGLV
ncbi:hypothetical protein TNIN_154501 [Trichonephila inaurata madagascariensis]|uniref:Uncharacterized protein n=1 Tax=Trichonephila inaurata madagascariensis TaxID=2747483 RepID=A0A8X6YHB8_9ARAC|nr:hypothetical protein TNIN_154501 [Trichonephila inaurata madagascariensis]